LSIFFFCLFNSAPNKRHLLSYEGRGWVVQTRPRNAHLIKLCWMRSILAEWTAWWGYHTHDQGRTGHITRWEKSHGAPLVWGPLRQSGAPYDLFFFFLITLIRGNSLFGQRQLPLYSSDLRTFFFFFFFWSAFSFWLQFLGGPSKKNPTKIWGASPPLRTMYYYINKYYCIFNPWVYVSYSFLKQVFFSKKSLSPCKLIYKVLDQHYTIILILAQNLHIFFNKLLEVCLHKISLLNLFYYELWRHIRFELCVVAIPVLL
jgi:hypothetical protein